MRIKRGKKYHKYVNFYRTVYKFVPPFKVLLDGNFFHHTVKEQINIRLQLHRILQDQPFIFLTKCVMRELENAGEDVLGPETLAMAKKTVKLPCTHGGGVISPDECILDYIGKRNENKVFVGTNDVHLRNNLRNKGICPIFFFQYNVLIMDAPSDVSDQKFKLKEQLKMEPSKQEKKFLMGQKKAIAE